MTQENEMPGEIQIDAKITPRGFLQVEQFYSKGGQRPAPINGNTRTSYIRRAVTKEEAGEAEIDFNNDPAVLYLLEPSTVETIRKLIEAHK